MGNCMWTPAKNVTIGDAEKGMAKVVQAETHLSMLLHPMSTSNAIQSAVPLMMSAKMSWWKSSSTAPRILTKASIWYLEADDSFSSLEPFLEEVMKTMTTMKTKEPTQRNLTLLG